MYIKGWEPPPRPFGRREYKILLACVTVCVIAYLVAPYV